MKIICSKLLADNQQYLIPLFQRFYVWEKPAWGRLWDDVMELLEDNEPGRTHFLGSMVVIPTPAAPGSVTQFVIIDGQQRLATLLVLLAVLRDHARHAANATLQEEIQQTLLVNRFRQGLDYYKLRLSQDDRIAFQHIIQAQPFSDPDHRLCQAYAFFDKKLRAHHGLDLRALFNAVADCLSVVTVTLDAHDNPYRVFESLNFTGQKLTEADLIRNHLFMRVPAVEQEALFRQYWKPMQDILGNDLTEFVRHYLMRSGAFVKKSEVYITLKGRLAQGDVRETLKELAIFAGYYAKLLSPGQEPSKPLSAALERINRLDVTTVYPFLLNVYDDYARHRPTETAFLNVLRVLENYLIRRFVCGAPTNELNKIFPYLHRQAQQQDVDDFVTALEHLLQGKNYPSDAQFRARLPAVKLYGKGGLEKKSKFLLETLERSYHHQEPVDFANLTIEHVMPQTLSDDWRAHLGADWRTIQDLYLHTLGNLTLTGYNSPLSNKSFAEKRAVFAKSHLELNRYFQNVDQWRPEDMQRRAEVLTERALQCWPYFGNAPEVVADGDEVTGTKPESVTVLGTAHNVKNWREVLSKTLETLAAAQPVPFAAVLDKYPHYIATSPQGFRGPKPLGGRYFIETNLAATSIQRFCQRAVATMGLPPEAWTVKVKPAPAGDK